MRVFGVLFLLSSSLLADVVVLKDGNRVSGKVVDKQKHWEVTTDGGLRTYLKEEVDKIIKDPKELLGDVEKVMGDAKDMYQKAVAMTEGPDRNALLKESITKIDAARSCCQRDGAEFIQQNVSDAPASALEAGGAHLRCM